MRLFWGEWLAFVVIGFVSTMLAALLLASDTLISWPDFYPTFLLNAAIIATGLALRFRTGLGHISATFVALGIYPFFSSLLALVFSLNFPLRRTLIDAPLMAIDTRLGYDWAQAVEWLAQYPVFAAVLAYVYMSSLGQLLVLLLLLGITGRIAQLHHFMLTGMLAAVILCLFWMVWPSFGPSAYLTPDPAAIEAASLIVTPAYGAQLMHLAEYGQAVIYRHEILGTVAFPSFHIFMAILAVWYARGTVLFWPFLLVNLLMLPATAIHGGHHLIDLPFSVLLFALAYPLADAALRARPAPERRAGMASA